MSLTVDINYLDAKKGFDPSKHPRGQPENKGEFAKTSGGGARNSLPKLSRSSLKKSTVAAGQKLYHGTNELSSSMQGSMVYLTSDPQQAGQYAKGVHHLGSAAQSPVVHEIAYKPGKSLNINQAIEEGMENDDEVDDTVEAAAIYARQNGYRYLEFDHPNAGGEGDHHVIISLYPKDDIAKQSASANAPAPTTAGNGSGLQAPVGQPTPPSAYRGAARKPGQAPNNYSISATMQKQLQSWAWSKRQFGTMAQSDQFAKTLNNLPQYDGPLWRGGGMDEGDLKKVFRPGAVVQTGQNLSTSTHEDMMPAIAPGRPGQVQFKLTLQGAHGADFASLNVGDDTFKNAGEVVIPKGRRFRVMSVRPLPANYNEGMSDHPAKAYEVVLKSEQ